MNMGYITSNIESTMLLLLQECLENFLRLANLFVNLSHLCLVVKDRAIATYVSGGIGTKIS